MNTKVIRMAIAASSLTISAVAAAKGISDAIKQHREISAKIEESKKEQQVLAEELQRELEEESLAIAKEHELKHKQHEERMVQLQKEHEAVMNKFQIIRDQMDDLHARLNNNEITVEDFVKKMNELEVKSIQI